MTGPTWVTASHLAAAAEAGLPPERAREILAQGSRAAIEAEAWKRPNGREVYLRVDLKADLKKWAKRNGFNVTAALDLAVEQFLRQAPR